MKKFFLFILTLIIIGLVLLAAYFVYYKFFASKGSTKSYNVVPKEAVFVIETDNLSKAWTNIHSSDLWLYLSQTEYFADIDKDIKDIQGFLDSNSIAGKIFKDRKLLVAAVMTTPKQWDFLFAIDLQKSASTINKIKSIASFLPEYEYSKTKYEAPSKNYKIIILTNKKDKNNVIYAAFVENILLISFNGDVIQKSLDQADDKHWLKDKQFVAVSQKIPNIKQFKIYINFKNLNDFTNSFITKEDPTIKMLSQSLLYSIFNLQIKDNQIVLNGYTNLDTIGGYIKALAEVNPAKMQAYKVITDQAAAFVSITFSNYHTFYNNLMEQYRISSPSDAQDIDKTTNILKKLAKIDLEKDLFSWIGNEIVLCKVRPLTSQSRSQDVAVMIQASDTTLAIDGLDNITTQIRRWSPFKFITYSYRGYKINFLKQKGFFKLFLGNIFEGIDEPFYTFIGSYAVFSNSEDVIHQMIDDYIEGRTIANSPKQAEFIANFEDNSNINIFLFMPKMYPTLYFYTSAKDRTNLKDNEKLIKSISQVGFQLKSEGDFFKTNLVAEYDNDAYYEDYTKTLENETFNDIFVNYIDTLGFREFLPKSAPNGQYVDFYDSEKKIKKVDGTILDNNPDGTWRSYFQSGNLKNVIIYSKGKAEGPAYFYYDDNTNTLRAEANFEDDKLDGIYKEYFNNSNLKAKITFVKGVEKGDVLFFYNSGKHKIAGKYEDDKKEGKWEYYDENENLLYFEKWHNGQRKK